MRVPEPGVAASASVRIERKDGGVGALNVQTRSATDEDSAFARRVAIGLVEDREADIHIRELVIHPGVSREFDRTDTHILIEWFPAL